MAFDWVPFLDANRIFYATSGPNVSRGHVAVACPFCGSADPSQHMSINLAGKGWRCFRNRDQHAGKSPVYLVQALLNTTLERAKAIVGDALFLPDDFMHAVMSKMTPPEQADRPPLELPDEFKAIKDTPSARRFVNYLTGPSRQFTRKEVFSLTRKYDLRYAKTGKMRNRIIFPIYHEGQLMSWTGRAISPNETLRYKTLSADPEIEDTPAFGPINDYLLWYDDLNEREHDSDTIVINEGPFDALKVSVLGARHGIDATCVFTASPSRRQIDLLHVLCDQYKYRYLLLDRGTLGTALRVQDALSSLKIPFLSLPDHIKDPGLLDERSLLKIIP